MKKKLKKLKKKKLKKKFKEVEKKTLPEAQRTQGIESIT